MTLDEAVAHHVAQARAEREADRREVDALLRGESLAVRVGIMAALEVPTFRGANNDVPVAMYWVDRLHAYEAARRRGMTVERATHEMTAGCARVADKSLAEQFADAERFVVAAYERTRGRR